MLCTCTVALSHWEVTKPYHSLRCRAYPPFTIAKPSLPLFELSDQVSGFYNPVSVPNWDPTSGAAGGTPKRLWSKLWPPLQ